MILPLRFITPQCFWQHTPTERSDSLILWRHQSQFPYRPTTIQTLESWFSATYLISIPKFKAQSLPFSLLKPTWSFEPRQHIVYCGKVLCPISELCSGGSLKLIHLHWKSWALQNQPSQAKKLNDPWFLIPSPRLISSCAYLVKLRKNFVFTEGQCPAPIDILQKMKIKRWINN